MRIAITNSVALNGGDAAITMTLYEALRQSLPDVRLEVHDASPEAARRYYPEMDWSTQLAALLGPRLRIPKVGASTQRFAETRLLASLRQPRRRLGHLARQTAAETEFLSDIEQIDVMISTGGTYLVEQYTLAPRLFEYRVAAALGIPVVFFTQSLGPFQIRRNRRLLRPIFEHSPLVLLRDEASLENVHRLGVSSPNIQVAADAVFLAGDERPQFSARRSADDPWHIGISVRSWPSGATIKHPAVRNFAAAVAEAVTHLARALPARFTFVSTCQGTPEYRIDDSALATHIFETLPRDVQECAHVDRMFHSPREFRELVGRLDLLIATRMHAAIQSLVVGTPVVPIAYEYKTTQLAARLGISEYTLDIMSVTGPALIDVVDRFIGDLDGLRSQLAARVEEQRAAAAHGMEQLARQLALIRDHQEGSRRAT
jgi:colanic acid/amylovoran biosynthesis protein